MSPPRRRQLTVAGARRHAEVIRLRGEGLRWAEIGEQLGVSPQRAHRLFRDALAAIPAADVDAYRAQLLHEGDEAVQALRRIVADPSESGRTKVAAIEAWVRWSDRLGRLLGTDAPQRSAVEVITADMVDQEIERLEAEQARLGLPSIVEEP